MPQNPPPHEPVPEEEVEEEEEDEEMDEEEYDEEDEDPDEILDDNEMILGGSGNDGRYGFTIDLGDASGFFVEDEPLTTNALQTLLNLGGGRRQFSGRVVPMRRAALDIRLYPADGDASRSGNDDREGGASERLGFLNHLIESFTQSAPPFAPPPPGASGTNDDVNMHPLLVNRGPPAGSVGLGGLQGRTGRQSDSMSMFRIEGVNFVGGVEYDRMGAGGDRGPLGVAVYPGGSRGLGVGTSGDSSKPASDFMPLNTSDRWYQESRMLYGNSMSDKAVNLVNRVLLELIPETREELQRRKELKKKRTAALAKERGSDLEMDALPETDNDHLNDQERKDQGEEGTERTTASLATETALEEFTAESSADARPATEEMRDDATPSATTPAAPISTAPEESSGPSGPMEEDHATPTAPEPTAIETTGEPSRDEQGEQNEQSERTTVMINGHEVDITNTGIDPTFLEALPDDLRQEVFTQHFREQRQASLNGAETGVTISEEFLEALPPEIREEILHDEALERQRALRREGDSGDRDRIEEGGPTDMDPADFIASLDPQLRQTVLLEQDDDFLSALPPSIIAEANTLRSRSSRRYSNVVRRTSRSPGIIREPTSAIASTETKKADKKDAIQLVDRSGLSVLIRLLFLPQPVAKSMHHRLLLNLCENAKTRSELITLILAILQDGSGDLAAVDRSFAQLCSRTGKTPRSASKSKTPSGKEHHQHHQPHQRAMPNLIMQRSLEALIYVASYNEDVVTFFLQENENLGFFKRPGNRKGKSKESIAATKYPVVILLSLLDRPVFVKNTSLMDNLTHLMSMVCRPLSFLAKEKKEDKPGKEKPDGSTAENSTERHGGDVDMTASGNLPQSDGSDGNTNAQEALTANSSTTPVTSSQQRGESNQTEAENQANIGESAANSDKDKVKEDKNEVKETEEEPALKPPEISDHYLRLVVHVLTAGECSGKTFQHTLSIIQHLSSLKGARDIITAELAKSAQDLGRCIRGNLDELEGLLREAKSGADIQGATLIKFSAPSSQQAKLLRVLKTIDYMYSRKSSTASNASNGASTLIATSTSAVSASTSEEDLTEQSTPAPKSGDQTVGSGEAMAVDDKITHIYDELAFTPLWQRLSECLGHLRDKPDVVHVATVLLPLVESFMVVSKYVAIKGPPAEMPLADERSRENATTKLVSTATTPEELFFAFTEEHRKILNLLVRNNPSLMSGSFSLLVHNPKMLEFDNKRNYFHQQLHKRTGARFHHGTLQLNVRRQYIFEDSFHQLQGRSGDEIKYGKLSVRFHDEEGVDVGGVTREWFSVLARAMFNPDYALFKPSAAGRMTYQPNRASWVNPDHLAYFRFVGRVIGKAIYDGRLLDAYFTRSFYKHMLGRSVDYRDVEAVDPEYYKSLVWMLENDITDIIDLTFSVETDDFGKTRTIDLKPGGRDIEVTEENKREYVKLVTEQKLTLAIQDQIKAFLAGLHDIVPPHLIRIFNEQELELLISGMPDIDIDDWRNNTEYQTYTPSSPQVQWFWRAVRSFDQEERAKLLQFVTGTSKVPLEGFSALQGSNGVQKFQIHKDFSSTNRLPSAHTCFNQLDLPEYESYEQLRQTLLTAIQECSSGFGFA
ncbi:uncharacterized protein VTP21DRAFT_10304 [Calcarisporiella thermophila]|uniref:uncharacterized protein n=1 Tax=Calcarisporiella thermophila TaxID=911321 RepID=UPI0037420F84